MVLGEDRRALVIASVSDDVGEGILEIASVSNDGGGQEVSSN